MANISDANGGGIASNQALYTGGAIYTYARPVALRNCTVVSNSTVLADGGGLCNCSLAVGTSNYLGTTLVAGNSAPGPADVIGVFTSGGYHLIGQIDYSIPADGGAALIPTDGLTNGLNHDRVGSLASPINPLIGPLRDNGGTTPTMAPLPGSLAIDNGLSNGLSTDQRGASRPFDFGSVANAGGGDSSDSGAFELGQPFLSIRPAGGGPVVSWPTYYGDFNLKQNAEFSTPNWQAPPQSVEDDGTNKFILVNPPTGNRFYRLSNP